MIFSDVLVWAGKSLFELSHNYDNKKKKYKLISCASCIFQSQQSYTVEFLS